MEMHDEIDPDTFFESLSKDVLVKAIHHISMYAISQVGVTREEFKEYWIHNNVYDPSSFAADQKMILRSEPLNFGFELILAIRKNPEDWHSKAEIWRDKLVKGSR